MEVDSKDVQLHLPTFFVTSLISGGLAGIFVDISLHPLDTLKTRLQSSKGFFKSGGFSQLYKGITPVIVGSAPTSALFFITYESAKTLLEPNFPKNYFSLAHMGSACLGEIVSCLIRVPVEVTKQRKQVLLQERGRMGIKLLYRGYWSTVLRDMPFSLIQFPIWEYLKISWSNYVQREMFPFEGAICGALAGGFSAAVTTPLDVAKTRIMLSTETSRSTDLKIINVLKNVYKEGGIKGCFAGIGPRIMWITLGGFIYFGVYDKSKSLLI